MRRLLLPAMLAAGLLLGASTASAGKDRVAILDFDGRGAERYERQVKKLLRPRARLISESKYRKTARKLRAHSTRSRHIAKVAEQLELDAVITGKMVRRRGKRYVKIYVRDGQGQLVDKFKVRAKKRLSRKVRRGLKKRLKQAVSDASDSTDESRASERHVARKRRAKERRSKKRTERRERERRIAAKERKARIAARKRKAREREDRRMAARAKAKYDDSGQAIDQERPPGL
ncbi:MAG: hypothetical protein KJO07_05170 [Deltaproteobacteria bacterium]|nr:hypothetical protein [Deltaproteobacteria bacterium]